jgi:hypothetical protein
MGKSQVTQIKITTKPEGTSFGQELPVDAQGSENYSGRVDLTLCSKFNGQINDGNGRTSVVRS